MIIKYRCFHCDKEYTDPSHLEKEQLLNALTYKVLLLEAMNNRYHSFHNDYNVIIKRAKKQIAKLKKEIHSDIS